MSGWVGVINTDGAPVNRQLLEDLTGTLRFRGPDAEGIQLFGPAGFGHTLLRTTFEAEHERQPCSIDGETWIAGDCRIDGRDDLIRELRGAGQNPSREASDPELILHAYAAWETRSTEHLIGDFSFAIYDAWRGRVFLARDQIGVKQLFYARFSSDGGGAHFVFGNNVHTLLRHPAATRKLNDPAIADFLIFGYNRNPETTSFEGIERLLPARRAVFDVRSGALGIERYWTLPIDEPLRLESRREYPEQFRFLLRTVVADRLRTNRVGIQMSGGLDSGILAAAAEGLARESGKLSVRAYTNVFEKLIPDEEGPFARLTAERVGIPVEFLVGDGDQFYEEYPRGVPLPDPAFVSLLGPTPPSGILDVIAAGGARVSLFGEGPDNALTYEWRSYARWEWEHRHYGTLLRDLISFPFLFGMMPMWGRMAAQPRVPAAEERLPDWLQPELVERLGLRERMEHPPEPESGQEHPARPDGYASFRLPAWALIFEGLDCAVSRAPVEVRHPFMDIRMLRFLLSLPVLPWCRDKFILRRAMRGALPAEVLDRPKSGVRGWPFYSIWQRDCAGAKVLPETVAGTVWSGASVNDYVNKEVLNRAGISSQYGLSINLRPRALGFFLQSLDR